MSQTSPQSSDPRSLIRYACVGLGDHGRSLLWTLYLVRGPLLLIYVSALFATGLAPLVRCDRAPALAGDRQAPHAASRWRSS